MERLKTLFRKKTRISSLPQPFTVRKLFQKFDIFYVCFDEPNRKTNWEQIQKTVPKAKKVEGVVGFDQALKTCAKMSATDYFFVIDGDNQVIAPRLENILEVPDIEDNWVLSWSSYNSVNGLTYGNGGLKLWPKDVALSINSHELADEDDDQTDYCFIADYYLVDDYVTETKMNQTPKQAFRAGFREGVKMSLAWGKQVKLDKENFVMLLGPQNRERLKVWCEVGEDAINGCWGILGARMGLHKNVIQNFDYQNINSYNWIDRCLEEEFLKPNGMSLADADDIIWNKKKLRKYSEKIGQEINRVLPMNLQHMTPAESLEFKETFKNPSRSGLLGRNPRC